MANAKGPSSFPFVNPPKSLFLIGPEELNVKSTRIPRMLNLPLGRSTKVGGTGVYIGDAHNNCYLIIYQKQFTTFVHAVEQSFINNLQAHKNYVDLVGRQLEILVPVIAEHYIKKIVTSSKIKVHPSA